MGSPSKKATLFVGSVSDTVSTTLGSVETGSAVIYVSDATSIVPGLVVSGAGFSEGTEVISVSGQEITVSDTYSDTANSNMYIFRCPEDTWFVTRSSFYDVNGRWHSGDISDGWLTYGPGTDPNSGIPLKGVFNRYKVVRVLSTATDAIELFIKYDGKEDSDGIPTPGTWWPISEPSEFSSLGAYVSTETYNQLTAGSVEGQLNEDFNSIIDRMGLSNLVVGQDLYQGATVGDLVHVDTYGNWASANITTNKPIGIITDTSTGEIVFSGKCLIPGVQKGKFYYATAQGKISTTKSDIKVGYGIKEGTIVIDIDFSSGTTSGGSSVNINPVELHQAFLTAYSTAYREYTFDRDTLSKVDIWEDSTKGVKLFTKNYLYDAYGNVIKVTTRDEENNTSLTKEFTYRDGRILSTLETIS